MTNFKLKAWSQK